MPLSKATHKRRAIVETALSVVDSLIAAADSGTSELIDDIVYEEFHRTGVDMTNAQVRAELKRIQKQLSVRRERILSAIRTGRPIRNGW